MILIDSNVWVDHFKCEDPQMEQAAALTVFMHPYVVAEMSLGSLRNRALTLLQLNRLPSVLPVRQSEVLAMVERDRLYSTGLQLVDVHLLASARVTEGCILWTRDRRLREAAERFEVLAEFS